MRRVFVVLNLPDVYVYTLSCWDFELDKKQEALADKFNHPVHKLLVIETDYGTEIAAKLRRSFKDHYTCTNTYKLADPQPLLDDVLVFRLVDRPANFQSIWEVQDLEDLGLE